MRNAHVAQWMLSLVTTPDRAASTVGDLLEDRATSGPIRFWASVVFTVVALLWRDLAGSPWRMARLAVYGLILQFLFMFVFMFVVFIGALAARGFGSRAFEAPFDPSAISGAIAITLFSMASQFQVGRVLAKRSPGSELAACVATTVLGYAVPIAIVIALRELVNLPTAQSLTAGPGTFVENVMYQILPILALLAGGARVRRQRLSLPR